MSQYFIFTLDTMKVSEVQSGPVVQWGPVSFCIIDTLFSYLVFYSARMH